MIHVVAHLQDEGESQAHHLVEVEENHILMTNPTGEAHLLEDGVHPVTLVKEGKELRRL
jgi:hypothetical protein